tara:strand:+ start:8270 stop:9847 length:1578 start_codon:yes stop_codon:yes gene_type:complete
MFGNNKLVIPVQAESITMATHRKLHAFPIPITSERIGVDVNQATMAINMSLVLEDDRGTAAFAGKAMKHLLYFGSVLGTTVNTHNKHGTPIGPTRAEKTMLAKGTYAAGATSVTVIVENLNAARLLGASAKVYDSYGEVGSKSTGGFPSALTPHGNTGKYETTITLTGGGLSRALRSGDYLSFDPALSGEVHIPVAKFIDQSIIKLVMDNGTVSNRAGGSGTCSVRGGSNLLENGDVIIDVPVGGVESAPSNGNPASTLALIIKDALELTTNITNLSTGVDDDGGKRVVDVSSVEIATTNSAAIFVEQKYIHPSEETSFVSTYSQGNQLVQSLGSIGKPPHGLMSAGDKAQTLLGLMANAKSKDVLRGIQIPYDSLIQSDAVTPVVRNFFTTYGNNAAPSVKGSVANVFPASSPMGSTELDSYDGVSVVDNADEDKGVVDVLLDKAEDALDFVFTEILNLGTLYDGFEQIATAIGETFSDGEVQTVTHAGGIYILPENFHLRKEAGKNHYVADLELVMVHRVAGV